MTAEEVQAWLLEHPLLLGNLVLTLLSTFVCFILFIVGFRPGRASSSGTILSVQLRPWLLQPLDFALFMAFLVLWFIAAGVLLLHLHDLLFGVDSTPGAWANLAGGIALQAGMFLLFWRFYRHHRHPDESGVSPHALSLARSAFSGLFYFLATLPMVYGVGALWNGLLEFLRQRGWEIDLPLQDAVMLFKEADNLFLIAGFFLLAVVVAPIVEETVFRGGIYRFLKGRLPLPIALLISGSLFGVLHGNLQSLPGLIAVGVFLGLAYEITGNLRVAIFFHACFNLNSLIWLLLLPEGVI